MEEPAISNRDTWKRSNKVYKKPVLSKHTSSLLLTASSRSTSRMAKDARLSGAGYISEAPFLSGSRSGTSAGEHEYIETATRLAENSGRSASSLMTGVPSSLHTQQQDRSKKPRTQFLPKQLYRLEEKFMENQFPNGREREIISKELELTPHHIQIWFQNRRAKDRRKKKRMKIEDTASHVPKPPPFWPANLSFDSNLKKQETSGKEDKDTNEEAQRVNEESPVTPSTLSGRTSDSTSSPAKDPPISPVSLPNTSSKSKLSNDMKHSRSNSPVDPNIKVLSSQCHAVPQTLPLVQATGQDRYYRQNRDSRLLRQSSCGYPLPKTLMSPPRYAESPVVLYDLLDDIPDLMSNYIDHPIPGHSHDTTRPPDPFHPQLSPDGCQSYPLISYYNQQSHGIGYNQPTHLFSPGSTSNQSSLPNFHTIQSGAQLPLYPWASSYNTPYPHYQLHTRQSVPSLVGHTTTGVSYSALGQIPSPGLCTPYLSQMSPSPGQIILSPTGQQSQITPITSQN